MEIKGGEKKKEESYQISLVHKNKNFAELGGSGLSWFC